MAEEVSVLVRQCLAGDQPSILEFVQRFQGRVFSFCYRMLGHHQDAEDATQETFIRVFRHLAQWDERRGAMEPWLLTIAGNRCRTRLAKRCRTPAMLTLTAPVADDALEHEAARLLAEELQLALGQLRPDYRDAFVLFHRDQKSYDEIAASLGVPLGTVKTWVHRARRQLVGRLSQRGVVGVPPSELSPV